MSEDSASVLPVENDRGEKSLGVFDVNAALLIDEVAIDLQKSGIEEPTYTVFVKTGHHRERAPQRSDWYYVRMASILYRLYKEGSLGTGSLRTYYGGRKNRGVKKHHTYKAAGKIIRNCLQALEKQGLVQKEKKGRKITGKGQKMLNEKAKVVAGKQKPKEERREFEVEKLVIAKEEKKDDGKKGKKGKKETKEEGK